MKKILGLGLLFSIFSFANITVDGSTNVYVEKSNNGIDIINISTPSPKGISHSTFKEFNVSEKGAVINNAKNIARSHIAGLINGNNNIKETRAKLALLDVTGIEESKLKGILEALSKDKLDVILSNPNGITLDGASFLNIHNMSLTTSKVNIDENNKVSYLKPTGDIKSLKELNTKENLEIVANKFTSDSDIYAKKLNVTTYAGEKGTLLSADIIGSIYGDVVKIVATKSGIGVKSITSKDLSLESKTQANIETIKTNNLDIKVEEDFINKDKIISNNSISIEANNILNDGNILISDNISLKAKENISNLNGAIIHADNSLNLESKNLNNIGKVNSYGVPIVKYKDKDGNIIENIEKWKTKLKETYVSYNAGILSTTDEAKINALSAFYDEKVVIDPIEFYWRVWKNSGDVKYNKERAGKPGIFYNLNGSIILSKEKIEEIKNKNKEAMYSQYSDNYLGESKENILLKGYVENTNVDTSFSILSGENINISTKNVVNNKDGHIIANKDNNIKTNTYNNSSSISDEKITIQDGYEKMIFDGSFNCPGGLVYCNILHNATYIRDLGNNREVNLKGLPSYIKGENILIDAENVNFKSYSENESKKTLREEDEKYVNNKEELEINGKKIEYNIEDNPKYVKLSNFLSNPYFLNNIKYNSNNKYLIENFKMNQNNLESKPSKSNITINAKNLNIKDQKLLFDNINLLSNNILIEGAKLKALDNLNIKADNITLKSIVEERETYLVTDEIKFINRYEELKKSSLEANNILVNSKETNLSGDIKAKENIDILSEKVNITGDKITNKSHILNNYTDILVKEEKIDNSTINAKNIFIKSKETNIVSSNLNVDEEFNIDSDKLLITNKKTKEFKELKTISNKEYLLDEKEISNNSNINAKEINLNNSETTIKASNVTVDKLIGKNIYVKSEILNNEYIKKSKNITYKEDVDVKYQENVSSNILAKNIKTKSLDIEGSNVEANKLETKDLNVKSQVLKTDVKQKVETFNLVDNVNGNADKENLKLDGSITLFSHKINKKDNSYEGNEKSNILVKEEANIDKLDILSSNVDLNNGKINSLNVKSQELNNKENENNYSGGLNLSGNIGITGIGAGINLNIQNQNIKSKSKIHESSNISLKGNTTIEKELDITNASLTYDNLTVDAKEVNFRAIKDNSDRTENQTGVNLGINASVSSPIVRDELTMGKGLKNLLDGNVVKAMSNVANGYVGAVDDLSSNVKIKKSFVDGNNNITTKYVVATREDLNDIGKKVNGETVKLKKDVSGYINIGGDLSLNISNKTILSHNEKVKGNTLSGGNISFNNNDKVNFTSTVIKDSKLVYNNVKEVNKNVEVENNSNTTIDASIGLGLVARLDTSQNKVNLGDINISSKVSTDEIIEKNNKLNHLEKVKEVYNNVENVNIQGLKTKDSSLEGAINNLSIKEVKDEKTRKKLGVGVDISLNISGMPTGGNIKGEFIDKREEKVYKNDLELSNVKVNNLTVKEEKENSHNIDFGYKVGTSGISGRVGDLDLSSGLVNAILNPEEFKHKQEMASKDIESTVKGIKSKIENDKNAISDELTDIADEEKRSLKELLNYHLNGEYIVRKINIEKAKTKNERLTLVQSLGFNDLKVFDKITDENIHEYSENFQRRYYEAKERGEELRVVVDQYGNVYTFGDMSELEFKKGIAREYGIHEEGRITEEGKLLGATSGNIYSEYVINGSEEIEQLSKDEISSIPSDAEVISDNLIKDSFKKVWSFIKEKVPIGLVMTDVYISTKTLGKYAVKGANLTAGQAIVLTVSVIDGLDEFNKYMNCGTIYGDCDTFLKKFLGDNVYSVFKGTATAIGITQIGKDIYTVAIKDGKIIEIGKKFTDINELKAVFSNLKESSKNVLNKGKNFLKSDKALDVVKNTVATKIDDILSISKQNDISIAKNSISGKIVSNDVYKVSYDTKKYGQEINDIIKNGDATGAKTEKIVDGILRDNPNLVVYNAKYGGNKGIDHLVYNKKTGEYWVIDSKQIAKTKTLESGGIKLLENGAKNERQLSKKWIEAGADKLHENEKNLLIKILDEKNYRTAVIGVNKNTGEIILVPLKVNNKIK